MKKSLFLSTIFFFISVLISQTPTAVTEFEGKGISQSEASSLTDRLRSELFKFGTFQIVERGLMEEILTEQGFQQTGCVSDECVVEVGKLIGVQQIIGGSISKVGKIFSISARLINVETGEIISIVTVDYEGEIGGLLKEGMRNVALTLVGKEIIPLISGIGSFYITSEPNEAKVWIDGNLMDGITPVLLENIPAGQRNIMIVKDDLSFTESVGLQPQEIKRLNFVLEKSKGGVSIITTPLNAKIKIDGKFVGDTPITVSDLSIGDHVVELVKDGFVSENRNILIVKNEIEKLKVNLSHLPILNVESIPSNSSVEIDGKRISLTPIKNYQNQPGTYELNVSQKKYETYSSEITLIPDSTLNITVELTRKTGGLKISSNAPGSIVYLDNDEIGKAPLNLDKIPTGFYTVRIKHDEYFSASAQLVIHDKMETSHHFELVSKETTRNEIINQNKLGRRWIKIGGGFGLLGGLFQLSSNLHYQQYKEATSEATDLHRKIDRENIMFPIGYGLSVLCFAKSYYHMNEEKKLENLLNTK